MIVKRYPLKTDLRDTPWTPEARREFKSLTLGLLIALTLVALACMGCESKMGPKIVWAENDRSAAFIRRQRWPWQDERWDFVAEGRVLPMPQGFEPTRLRREP